MKDTLEKWISDIQQVIDEKQVLLEHGSLDEWNQSFLREQIEMWNDKLALLYELQAYRKRFAGYDTEAEPVKNAVRRVDK